MSSAVVLMKYIKVEFKFGFFFFFLGEATKQFFKYLKVH